MLVGPGRSGGSPEFSWPAKVAIGGVAPSAVLIAIHAASGRAYPRRPFPKVHVPLAEAQASRKMACQAGKSADVPEKVGIVVGTIEVVITEIAM